MTCISHVLQLREGYVNHVIPQIFEQKIKEMFRAKKKLKYSKAQFCQASSQDKLKGIMDSLANSLSVLTSISLP